MGLLYIYKSTITVIFTPIFVNISIIFLLELKNEKENLKSRGHRSLNLGPLTRQLKAY